MSAVCYQMGLRLITDGLPTHSMPWATYVLSAQFLFHLAHSITPISQIDRETYPKRNLGKFSE